VDDDREDDDREDDDRGEDIGGGDAPSGECRADSGVANSAGDGLPPMFSPFVRGRPSLNGATRRYRSESTSEPAPDAGQDRSLGQKRTPYLKAIPQVLFRARLPTTG
jgi:hypothetical protein